MSTSRTTRRKSSTRETPKSDKVQKPHELRSCPLPPSPRREQEDGTPRRALYLSSLSSVGATGEGRAADVCIPFIHRAACTFVPLASIRIFLNVASPPEKQEGVAPSTQSLEQKRKCIARQSSHLARPSFSFVSLKHDLLAGVSLTEQNDSVLRPPHQHLSPSHATKRNAPCH